MERQRKINRVVNVRVNNLRRMGYRDFKDWGSHKDHIYIGRDMNFYVEGAIKSKWHNPYPVKKDKKYKTSTKRYTLDESLRLYREHIETNPELINDLHDLVGKTLGCWCKPNRCHGDILAELVLKYCGK